jgi:hypothetical protein
MKNGVFWDVTPCGSCKNRRLERTHSLHHQRDKNSELGIALALTSNRRLLRRNNRSGRRLLVTANVPKLYDSRHLDDAGATFLRNVSAHTSHTASHPRRRHSS